MKLTVMGTEKEFKDGMTIKELIDTENVEAPLYVTVAVNDKLYSSKDFETTVLKDNDTIEFLYFMGGGSCGIYQ